MIVFGKKCEEQQDMTCSHTSLGDKAVKGKFSFTTVPQSCHAEQTTMLQQLLHDTRMRPEEKVGTMRFSSEQNYCMINFGYTAAEIENRKVDFQLYDLFYF